MSEPGIIPPKVYFASKLYRAANWREIKSALKGSINVVSTWHDDPKVLEKDQFPKYGRQNWIRGRHEIIAVADWLIAYAMEGDPLNGTLVEIGMAIGHNIPVILVGTYPWASWKYSEEVVEIDTLHHAFLHITQGEFRHDKT